VLRGPAECSAVAFCAHESPWLQLLPVVSKDTCSASVLTGSLEIALTEDLYHNDGCDIRP